MKKCALIVLCLVAIWSLTSVSFGISQEYPQAPPRTIEQAAPQADNSPSPQGQAQPQVQQQTGQSDYVLFDIMILRPAGLIACLTGIGASIIALPFALPSGSQSEVVKTLIVEPCSYTFVRPVGQREPEPQMTN